jgi:hypothetical protein
MGIVVQHCITVASVVKIRCFGSADSYVIRLRGEFMLYPWFSEFWVGQIPLQPRNTEDARIALLLLSS